MYNVLICDDQPDIVNALKIYLAPEGYNLFEAFTGLEALDIVRNNEIQRLLCLSIVLGPNTLDLAGYTEALLQLLSTSNALSKVKPSLL